jgi:hypothetical protein
MVTRERTGLNSERSSRKPRFSAHTAFMMRGGSCPARCLAVSAWLLCVARRDSGDTSESADDCRVSDGESHTPDASAPSRKSDVSRRSAGSPAVMAPATELRRVTSSLPAGAATRS